MVTDFSQRARLANEMAQEQCNASGSSGSSATVANVFSTGRKRKLDDEGAALVTEKWPLHKNVPWQIDSICPRCTSILPSIMSSYNSAGTKEGAKLCDLGSSDTWLVATCDLCKLLSAIRPDCQDTPRYDLMAFHISVLFRVIPHSNALTYLKRQKRQVFGIVPEGYPTVHPVTRNEATYLTLISPEIDLKEEVYVRLVPERVDYDLLKTWISHCENKHWKFCRVLKPNSLPCKRVIDCWEKSIIIAPHGCKYVALSYVWGKEPQGECWKLPSLGHQRLVPLPSDLPMVITGAMDVTRKLDHRFLWVDKYCINYRNVLEKNDQIKAMELIYGCAELTICAAFGEHHNSGLPRVNTAIRKPQSSAIIQGMQFATTLSHPVSKIMKSKWSKRGWTHQEAVLSPRRLIFTEEQTYFVCNAMECQESVHILPEKLHKANGRQYAGEIMLFQPYSSRPRNRFSNFMEHVREYTSRNLTRQTDSLCAFLGILHKFESCSPPINNLFGLPIVSGMAVESFTYALTWIHDRQYNTTPVARRRDFPSYSFVGWRGAASTHTGKGNNKTVLKNFHVTDVEIQVHRLDSEAWSLEDIKKLRHTQGVSQSLLKLWIKAPVLPSNIWSEINKEDLQGSSLRDVLHFEIMMQVPTRSIKCRAEVSGKMRDNEFLDAIKRGDLDCLLLGFLHLKDESYQYFVMIVMHDGGQNTERVGILSFTISGQDLKGQVLELAKERRGLYFKSSTKL